MKELLVSELQSEAISPLQAVALIEEYIFENSIDLALVESLITHCQKEISSIENPLEQAEELINEIYIHQLFIDKHRAIWSVESHKIIDSLSYRTTAPVLKAIFLKHIIDACGLKVEVVFVPEKIMLRIVCDEDFAIVFDPVTGESLSWHDIDARLGDSLSDHFNQSQDDYLQLFGMHELVVNYLTSLKTALIHNQQFALALKCVDILLALRPDDPFERRDRGFLLQQLDCFKVAYDDYRYFVEQCPKDPAAQLLKYQLDNIVINDTVLH